jgi:hypothetical protein
MCASSSDKLLKEVLHHFVCVTIHSHSESDNELVTLMIYKDLHITVQRIKIKQLLFDTWQRFCVFQLPA